MSLFDFAQPVWHAQYRAGTDRRKAMAGVTLTPRKERCICCGDKRNAETGEQTEQGFLCNFCLKNSRPRQRAIKNQPLVALAGPAGCFGKQEQS